jgi:heme-binding NEAT domain protein
MKEEDNTKAKREQPATFEVETNSKPLSTEGQIVIEEKQSKPNGEVDIIQYIRGNFLGKVSKLKFVIFY